MSASLVETLEDVADQMTREDRYAWADLVRAAASTLAGRARPDPALVEILDWVAEQMLEKDRPAWSRQVVAAADTLRQRLEDVPPPRRKVH